MMIMDTKSNDVLEQVMQAEAAIVSGRLALPQLILILSHVNSRAF